RAGGVTVDKQHGRHPGDNRKFAAAHGERATRHRPRDQRRRLEHRRHPSDPSFVSEVIDHVGIRVADLAASRRMYEAALAELGFAVLSEGEFENDAYVSFGRGHRDDFALHDVGTKPGRDHVTTGAHIAFIAQDAAAVDCWHDAAVRNGASDNGAPGVRPEYVGYYYAAFVIDLDGNNVEAVFNSSTPPGIQ